jgi:hypothetical protein
MRLARRACFAPQVWIALAAPVAANQVCHTASTPLLSTNWSNQVVVPRFDPGLGTLDSVTLELVGHVEGSASAESLDGSPSVLTFNFSGQFALEHPSGWPAVQNTPSLMFNANVDGFDGLIDFRGASGVSFSGLSVDGMPASSATTSDPGLLALYVGPPGNPGNTGLPVHAVGVSTATGNGNLITQFLMQGSAAVNVCYNYTPRFSSFCAGDGTGTACPCGNQSPPNQGCLNSLGFGSQLTGAGAAVVGNDTAVISATVGATAPTTFFQGTAKSNNGLGLVFGDGLRCVSGIVVRLQTASASNGVAMYPHPGDPPISIRGSVPAGATRYYQAWYRQAAAFCTPSTFNLSQGLQVVWGP